MPQSGKRASFAIKFSGKFLFYWVLCLTIYSNNGVTNFLGKAPKFPRRNVWDPYKRLGISPYASEEEVWSSRNFLMQQYAGDEQSVEAIEAAFEKLLMKSFQERKKTKINLKAKLKQKVEESPSWVKNLLKFVELPQKVVILRRLFLFVFLAGWSIMNSAETGPAFQVCIKTCFCSVLGFLPCTPYLDDVFGIMK